MPYLPAPFGRRLLARIIDLAFSLLLTFVVAVPVAILLLLATPVVALVAPDRSYDLGFGAAGVCYLIAYVGIEVFLLVRRDGQTLGKGLMGLRVVRAAPTSTPTPIALGAAVVRMLIIFLPFALMSAAGGTESATLDVLALLGSLSLLVNLLLAAVPTERRATLHDLVAGSRVVRAPKRRIEWMRDARMMVPGRVDLTKRT